MENDKQNLNFKLIRKKESLERQLDLTSLQLKHIQYSCNHIEITIGYFGNYLTRDTAITECLLCGKNNPCASLKRTIDASGYQRILYGNGSSIQDGNARIDKLRKLWEGYKQKDENISEEEMINKLKEDIQQDIEKTRILEKKYNRKFK